MSPKYEMLVAYVFVITETSDCRNMDEVKILSLLFHCFYYCCCFFVIFTVIIITGVRTITAVTTIIAISSNNVTGIIVAAPK